VRRSFRALISVVATALCMPLAVGVVLLAVKASRATERDGARHGALGAAARIARDLLSYDYRTIDRDLTRARAETTGTFAGQYAATATQLRAQAVASHAIVQARVRDTGIVSASAGHVVVLAYIDQVSITRTSASAVPTTRLIPSAVQMTLSFVGGRWRVSALSALQTGAGSAAG
jgi:Mce-associated membrane protein